MFGLDKFFDRAKGALIGAGAASVLALAGVFCLAASLAALLATWLTWPAALALTALAFLTVAGLSLWLGVRGESERKQEERVRDKDKDREKESEQFVDAALALVDLPVEAAKRIVMDRPVAALVLVSGLGFLVAKQPRVAAQLIDKVINRFTA